MCQSEKEKKSSQEAAQSAENVARSEGQRAETNIIAAGQPSETEKGLQSTFTTRATQPAEQNITDAGPISQAVSQRILERTQNPGMDYDVASINKSIGNPVWAGLKQRGIAAQPGDTSGGGVGTEQYMQQMVPYLAAGKQAQINTDINAGQTYSQNALTNQTNYSNLASAIAQALSNRNLQAVETGTPYRVSGMNNAEAINQQSVAQQNAQKQTDLAALFTGGASLLMPMLNPVAGQVGNNVAGLLTSNGTPTANQIGSLVGNGSSVTGTNVLKPSDLQLQSILNSYK